MAFVKGLYPDGFEGEIWVADKSLDHWRKSSLICPKLKERIAEVREGAEYIREFEKGAAAMKTLGKLLKCKAGAAPDIAMTTRCDGRSLGLNISEEMLDDAAFAKGGQQGWVYKDERVFPLMFSFSMSEIVNAMIGRLNGEDSVRFIHWSAHDGNILGFLGYLGLATDILPPYGSYVTTELWRCRRSGLLLVRFIYNGKVVQVPRMGGMKIVEFWRLVRFVRENMPDLKKDCGFRIEKFAKANVLKTD
jgi:acid phosphatase